MASRDHSQSRDELQTLFLQGYSRRGIIKDGLEAANVHRSTYQYWLDNLPDFAEAVEDAKEEANDNWRRLVYERAEGYQEELHFKGLKTGDTVTKWSESLLTLVARSRMPREFRQNQGIELSESAEMSDIRSRFLDRLSAMAERMQADEPTAIEPGSTE